MMDPVTALRQIAYYKDRAREDPRRVMAYRNAADVVEALTAEQRAAHGKSNSWQSLPKIGPKTAAVIAQAWVEKVRGVTEEPEPDQEVPPSIGSSPSDNLSDLIQQK